MASRLSDPLVILRARDFKRALLAREDAQMREMARRWIEIERTLQAEIERLAAETLALRERGEPVTPGRLWRLERYRSLLRQTRGEFEGYVDYATDLVTSEQRRYGELGIEHTSEVIELGYLEGGRMGVRFDRLPVAAIERMAGLAGNGQPVGLLLRARMVRAPTGEELPGVWDRLTQTLVDSTAIGRNPRATARLMRDDLSGGLQKAMTIARTEQLRVYRQTSADNYAESGVVLGHRRLTAHDARVCPACLADEGTVYPVGVPISDHPNGRCSSTPVLRGLPEPQWVRGEAWLRTQSRSVQQQILGPGRWTAWRAGAFDFHRLTVKRFDPVWGESLTPAPLQALVGSRG